jgi:hypothetical protein
MGLINPARLLQMMGSKSAGTPPGVPITADVVTNR